MNTKIETLRVSHRALIYNVNTKISNMSKYTTSASDASAQMFAWILLLFVFAIIFGFSYLCNYLFYLATRDTKAIIVKEKYIKSMYRQTVLGYMIVDTDNNHYQIKGSLLNFEFNNPEMYSSAEINSVIKIEYYGFRSQFLGIYPIIYKIGKI